jgi:osmotically-inducible protein OsmY
MPSSSRPDTRDIQIAVRARRALSQDSELARLNVGVSVRQGSVTLWGRVPTAALAKRAEQIVQKTQGVFSVRSELEIKPVELERDDTPGLSVPIAVPSREQPAASREPRSPGVLAKNPRDAGPRRSSSPDAAWMGMPVPVKASPPDADPPAKLLKPIPVENVESLQTAVQRLIQADVRFSDLRSELCDGVVTLGGTVTLMAHAMDLARQISRLPGVKSVVVEHVRVAPR